MATSHAQPAPQRCAASLELAACKELAFTSLAQVPPAGAVATIRILDVSYTNVTARDVATWLGLCASLQALKLNGCSLLECPPPRAALQATLGGEGDGGDVWGEIPFPNLELADYPLACLSTHQTLAHVSLVGCHNLTWLWLTGSPQLLHVSVRSCAALLCVRVDGCAKLRTFSAVDCSELASISATDCGALDGLDIRFCPPGVVVAQGGTSRVEPRRW